MEITPSHHVFGSSLEASFLASTQLSVCVCGVRLSVEAGVDPHRGCSACFPAWRGWCPGLVRPAPAPPPSFGCGDSPQASRGVPGCPVGSAPGVGLGADLRSPPSFAARPLAQVIRGAGGRSRGRTKTEHSLARACACGVAGARARAFLGARSARTPAGALAPGLSLHSGSLAACADVLWSRSTTVSWRAYHV